MKIGDEIDTPEIYSRLNGAKRYCVKFENGAIKGYWDKDQSTDWLKGGQP